MWADSYTLSGCATAEHCGVFHRVAAHCDGGDWCGSDATLCDGAPAFQRPGGGAVLYRGGTAWWVGPSSALGDCDPHNNYYRSREISSSNSQPSPLPPDVVGYGWSDPGGYSCSLCPDEGAIHITK